jgi:hypothetical protein
MAKHLQIQVVRVPHIGMAHSKTLCIITPAKTAGNGWSLLILGNSKVKQTWDWNSDVRMFQD